MSGTVLNTKVVALFVSNSALGRASTLKYLTPCQKELALLKQVHSSHSANRPCNALGTRASNQKNEKNIGKRKREKEERRERTTFYPSVVFSFIFMALVPRIGM